MKFDQLTAGTVYGPLTGKADTMTQLKTKRKIGGVDFDGSANIDLKGVNKPGDQDTTGNAATADKLKTAVTIGGVSFDGNSANINLPGVDTTGTQSTTGNAGTTFALKNSRTIGGVNFDDFDSVTDINLPGVNTTGNQDTSGNAASASKFKTSRKIGGVDFDGSANIDLPGVNIKGNQRVVWSSSATTAYNQSGGSVKAATGTFSGLLYAPSMYYLSYVDTFDYIGTNTQSIANGSIDELLVLKKTFVAPDACKIPYSKWNLRLDVRWFGEIGPNNNENIMWSADISTAIGSVDTINPNRGNNRNGGLSTQVVNFWRQHTSTPEVMDMTLSGDLTNSVYYFTTMNLVYARVLVHNKSGGAITVATNRTIANDNNGIHELGTSFMKITYSRIE